MADGLLPSDVPDDLTIFDRFADTAGQFVSHAPFFAACVVLVIVWAPSYLLVRDLDTWQLLINTPTTIITFLLVALLNNSQSRSSKAMHHKLNAIAEALADLIDDRADEDELRAAVGLEHREPSTD